MTDTDVQAAAVAAAHRIAGQMFNSSARRDRFTISRAEALALVTAMLGPRTAEKANDGRRSLR